MMNPKNEALRLGVAPSKKLGQNFLLHENTAKKIIEWAAIPEQSNVLEIGPGLGALTFGLTKKHPLALVEADQRLFAFLRSELKSDAQVFHADILEFDLSLIFPGQPFFVISNAPYSISTPILEKMLSQLDRIQGMAFLFQEEVVDRICAKPKSKDYGRLSIWIQCQCRIQRGPRISRENFFPKPDVESRLVRLTPLEQPLIDPSIKEEFLNWVAKIFQKRRKTLRKVLKDLNLYRSDTESFLMAMGLSSTVRAEELSIEQLLSIHRHVATELHEGLI